MARYWRLRLERALGRPTCLSRMDAQPVEFRVAYGDGGQAIFYILPADGHAVVHDGHCPRHVRSTIVWCREEALTTGVDWRIFGDGAAVETLLRAARTPPRTESWLSVRLNPPG